MIAFEEAFSRLRESVVVAPSESVPLRNSLGRVLAESVFTRIDLPIFDNSAVDGYALAGQTDRYRLVGEIAAGTGWQGDLGEGECVRIFTGAPVPREATAVAMQEDVERDGDLIRVSPPPKQGAHIRRQGEELRVGDELFPRGTLCNPAVIGALAAAGVASVSVYRGPSVALLTTGNELVEPGTALAPGQIYESNRAALAAALSALGLQVRELTARDDLESLEIALRSAFECDVVITTGGVSVGDHDLVRPLMHRLGVQELFWGVAMKPAKPTFVGTKGEKVFFGLPGNPVSAMVAFALFVGPYLLAMQGLPFELSEAAGKLDRDIEKAAGREEFVPGRLSNGLVTPNLGRASHKSTSLAFANVLIRVPAESTRLPAGAEVSCVRLDWGWA